MDTNANSRPPSRQLTPDQEAMLSARLRSLLRMGITLRQTQKTGMDNVLLECAMDGLINGAAIEIARAMGLEPCFTNLERPKSMGQPPSPAT